jgi:HEXXH motif-containing protein
MTTTSYHRLPEQLLDGLAGSAGGPDASRALAEAQLSKHLLLIADLLRRWSGPAGERDHLIAALEAARSADPAAAARVLGSPMVGAWVTIVSRAADEGLDGSADLAHLGAVAAVTCAAAGVDIETNAPVRDNAVALPGLGRLIVGEATTARLTVTGGVVTADAGHGPVTASGPETGHWQPVRTLRADSAGLNVALVLEDLDPYRHGYHAPPMPRLTEDEFQSWQDLFTEAWRLLAEHIPYRAAEIATGLHALVPLHREGRSALSATIRHVSGVFGLTRPVSPEDFAVTLVHEYQHVKLSSLLDLTQLTDPADTRRYFAPWRTDPRPLGGLLQGVYAFAGVADTWRALREADGVTTTAEQEFADARLHVDRSLAEIESSDALTPAGEQFAAQLRAFTDSLLAVPLPAEVARQAEDHHRTLHERWLAANAG